jgi:hypothetical protein
MNTRHNTACSDAVPISAKTAAAARMRLPDVRTDGRDVIWSESRPGENARVQLVRMRPDGKTTDLLPSWADARSRVHEYGGAAWWMHDGSLWFVNWADQRLYSMAQAGVGPTALTAPPAGRVTSIRYADGDVSADGASMVCVREMHFIDRDGDKQVVNEIVRLSTREPGQAEVLISGPDFVTHPRLRADGIAMCWLQWDHPALPWHESVLMVREFDSGRDRVVAGGNGEWVSQPSWQPDGHCCIKRSAPPT